MNTSFRITSLLIVIALAISAFGQRRREDKPLPDELYNLFVKKTETLQQAIKISKNEWAGTYLAGDHHPTVFQIEPSVGFLVSSSRHTFAPSWINYGKIAIEGNALRIFPELDKNHDSAHVMPVEFRMVRWGGQRFLLTREEFPTFSFAVHARDEDSIVQYFARVEDREKERTGLPDLPTEFQAIMRMQPIIAKVISVGPEEGFHQTVTIDAGSEKKIAEGMMLYWLKGSYQFSIRITEVTPGSAVGEVWSRASIRAETGPEPTLKAGMRFSSRMPKDFIGPG